MDKSIFDIIKCETGLALLTLSTPKKAAIKKSTKENPKTIDTNPSDDNFSFFMITIKSNAIPERKKKETVVTKSLISAIESTFFKTMGGVL